MGYKTKTSSKVSGFHAANPGYRPETLRKLRQDMFLSQRELAILSGVSRETIIRIEAGTVKPYGPTVEKLAAALGFDPLVLVKATGRSEVR